MLEGMGTIMNKPIFDLSKYTENFFADTSLKELGNQVASIKIPVSPWWLSALFLFLKVTAMSAVYAMWKSNKEAQMLIDKQRWEQAIENQIQQGDDVL